MVEESRLWVLKTYVGKLSVRILVILLPFTATWMPVSMLACSKVYVENGKILFEPGEHDHHHHIICQCERTERINLALQMRWKKSLLP